MIPKEQGSGNARVLRARPRKNVFEDADDFEIEPRRRKRDPSQRDDKRNRKKRKAKSDEPLEESQTSVDVDETLSLAWVEKYKPSERQPFIGNATVLRELRQWLEEWKTVRSNRAGTSQNSDSEASVEGAVSNCMLLHGPPGSGKTSVVYYMAQELGYKVIEVNVSSERPGKKILAQLQEATQSHHVEGTKTPQAFQNLFRNQLLSKVPNSLQAEKDSKPVKAQPKAVKQRSRDKLVQKAKPAANSNATLTQFFSPKVEKKVDESVVVIEEPDKVSPKSTMLDYFGKACGKKGAPANKTGNSNKPAKFSTESDDVTVVDVKGVDDDIVVCEIPKKKVAAKKTKNPDEEAKQSTKKSSTADDHLKSEKRQRKDIKRENKKALTKSTGNEAITTRGSDQPSLKYSSLTVILFDDVDVIFPQDEGFWGAVESFLSQTKKPVIFTATCHIADVQAKLPSHCLSIKMLHPGIKETRSFLQDVLTKEQVPVISTPALDFLVRYHNCDLRQCLLQVQFECALKNGLQQHISLTNVPHDADLRIICQEESTEELSDLQSKYRCLGLDVLYLSIPAILSPSVVETIASPINFGVSHWIEEKMSNNDGINVSWLTDSSIVEDNVKDANAVSQSKSCLERPRTHPPLQSKCLHRLSDMFDTFSSSDVIQSMSGTALGHFGTLLPSERWQIYCDAAASVETETSPQSTVLMSLSEAAAYLESGTVKQVTGILQTLLFTTDKEGASEPSFSVLSTVPRLNNFEAAAGRSRHLWKELEDILTTATSLGHKLCMRDVLQDYASALHQICCFEQDRKDSNPNRGRRFLHYLNTCNVFLSSENIKTLCEEWMS